MKKLLFYLSAVCLSALLFACGKIDTPCELIDSAPTCSVTTDKNITLIRNDTATAYILASTADLFVPTNSLICRNLLSDSCQVYIYHCKDGLVASQINIDDARAIRSFLRSSSYSASEIAGRCGWTALAAFIVGCMIYFFRKSDFKWFLGFVPILIIVFASLPEKRVSFVGEGVLAAVSGKIVQTGSQTAVLYQTDDICTGCPLQLNRQIFIYRYQNLFFASHRHFAPATLAYSETIPETWGIYLVCWLISATLGCLSSCFLHRQRYKKRKDRTTPPTAS